MTSLYPLHNFVVRGDKNKKSYSSLVKQEVSLKKIIVEGYRAVGSLNDRFQSSNFLLAPFVVLVLH